jgi:membrane protein involved in colicin uptake
MSAITPPPPANTGRDINNLIGELVQKIQDEFELRELLEGRIRELDIDLTPSGT